MKLITYFRFFIYLVKQWNFILALYIIYYEIKGEWKYGINTSGIGFFKFNQNGSNYLALHVGSNYYILEALIKQLNKNKHNNTFIDMGSGKGRVMVVAAAYGFRKIIGVEFSDKLCEEAIANITVAKKKFKSASFEVINKDASFYKIPDDITTFFFANPFDEAIMRRVVDNIQASWLLNPRNIRIVYLGPVYKKLFLEQGYKEVFQIGHIRKRRSINAVILEK